MPELRWLASLPPEARLRVETGRAHERSGGWPEARTEFEEALRLGGGEAGTAGSTLHRWIARTWLEEGNPDAAESCLENALGSAEGAGDRREVASVLNSMASLHFVRGDLDAAEQAFRDVREMAVEVWDVQLAALAEQNLGAVAGVRGEPVLALVHFHSALRAFQSLGETASVLELQNNIGRLHIDLGAWSEAEHALDEAHALCRRLEDRRHLVVVEVNRARLALARGRADEARAALDRALELARSSGSAWMPEILRTYGVLYRHLGHYDAALSYVDAAERSAVARWDPALPADLARERAAIHRALGDSRATLLALNEAHRLYRELRARRELADVDRRLAELQEDYLGIVREWGASIEGKDPYTQGHSCRVAEFACLLAAEAGLDESDMPWFRMGALLHDVGKIDVPLSVLNKRGPLAEDEMAIMRGHPRRGVELVEETAFPWDVRPMILHHHERWDGSGYPDGLAGEAIPLTARILTVADVFDALTSARSYRGAFEVERALEVMDGEAGRTVDPRLFGIFRSRVVPRLASGRRQEEAVRTWRRRASRADPGPAATPWSEPTAAQG